VSRSRPSVLLLDLGNVTVRLRSEGFFGRLRAVCDPARVGEDPRRILQDPSFGHADYERGRISGRDLHARLQARAGLSLGYEDWVALWNDFFEPNAPMEALVAALRGQVRIWGLSNTNAEHLAFLRRQYRVLDAFEGVTASHEAGSAKPEPAIYRAALGALHTDPGELLYLDDVKPYVDAAAELGIPGFHYTFNDAALVRALRDQGFTLPDTF